MNVGLSVQVHDGNGPPLLLVHGMLASRSQWLLNLESFSKFAKPITVELLGHHLSPSPTDPNAYKPCSYVDIFDAIRKDLGIDRWFVGGCSLGAALTMRYSLSHPDKVLGQFLTNSSSAFADVETSNVWRENSAKSFDNIMQGGMKAINRIAVHPRHGKHLPESVKSALVADSESHSVLGIASTMRWTSPLASVRDEVQKTKVPTMLLCGMLERRFKPLRAVALSEVPGIEIHDLEAGHAVNMEAAEAFNAQVRSFIRAHTTSQAHVH